MSNQQPSQQPYGMSNQQPNQQPYGMSNKQPNQQQPLSKDQEQPEEPGIFTVEPAGQNQKSGPVNDYFGYSIFTMVCCCLPMGIVALINAIDTRKANASGDGEKAKKSSRRARIMSHGALGTGIGIYVLIAIIVLIVQFV
ncbi:synapse differentiation-inducing gene protein 1-like [Poecilia reticulata]|uniref:synapse differentiation-inducing gene protein 1-like n=1 Tax=Poecilia reticulata TaxID=8081 RepID=UPI0007EB2FD7|nr:PREDICTED: synapse differentiation-inducing gene protein 1-like [Poecilia reticulata]